MPSPSRLRLRNRASQTKALAEVREEIARVQETAKKSPYSETDEWQMLELYPDEPDHCAAKWYFDSARRRLVEKELVDRFPDMYGLTDENTTKGRMQLPATALRNGDGYEVDWANAYEYFKSVKSLQAHTETIVEFVWHWGRYAQDGTSGGNLP